MAWSNIDHVPPPIDRPLMIRTREDEAPQVAFLSRDGVWYRGGALVQNATTLLGATPTAWCEPEGDDQL